MHLGLWGTNQIFEEPVFLSSVQEQLCHESV